MVCSSGIGFDPIVKGKRLLFGFVGIWRGTAVIYDRGTESLWFHLSGLAFAGPLRGRRMAHAGTGRHTTWGAWRTLHPTTQVMAQDKRLVGLPGDRGYFPRGAARRGHPMMPSGFARTLGPADARLPRSALVYGVEAGGQAMAFTLDRLVREGLLSVRVGDVPLALWVEAGSSSVSAFLTTLDDEQLTLTRDTSGRVVDAGGTAWDADGLGHGGAHDGRRLRAAHGLLAEWYGWSAHHPGSAITK